MKKMNITIAKLVPFDVISFLQVEDKSAKQTYFFLCQRWLATDEDDGQIMRTLVPVDPSLKAKMGSGSKSIRDEVALEQKGRKHEIVRSTAYIPNIYAWPASIWHPRGVD